MPHSSGIGAIFGIVSENGIAKAGGRVGLYDRTTMQLLTKTNADSLGGYVFSGLNQNTNDYLVLALDDDGSPAKNALVQDYIQPISAHMGSAFPGNWFFRSMRKNPHGIWIPRFHSTGHLIPTVASYGFPPSMTYQPPFGDSGGTFLTNQPTITPGAPHLPTLKFQVGWIMAPGRMHGGSHNFATPTTELTLEWMCDCTYSATMFYGAIHTYTSVNARLFSGVIGMSWDRANNRLRGGVAYDFPYDGYNIGFTGDMSNNNSQWGWSNYGEYVNAGITSAPHHFVWAMRMGVEGKLYIDGVLVATKNLTGGVNAVSGGRKGFFLYTGVSAAQGVTNITNHLTGPIACYPTKFTDADVLNHYTALTSDTTPLVTGYARDVMVDEPSFLIRCNAGSFGTEAEFMSQETLAHYGAVTVAQPSPVVGSSMTAFGGGVLYGDNFGAMPGYRELTLEFFVNPDTAAPPADRVILAGRHYDETTYNYYIQQRITTGRLRIVVRNSVPAMETVDFDYVPVAAVTVLVQIVLDKINGEARLYINGAWRETKSLLTGFFQPQLADYTDSSNYYFRILHIGGLRTAVGAISQPFFGKISEIAAYTRALTPDRLLSHYNSRTLI